ncbi:bifunctional hydroxymethylpyrimidine kinase/phosphomethylpyrimidine kinase [Vibrio sp. JC009]|uniref:bifunctional hydroxymethylpyrimidine kinase/phosphomethylpyrimidine kinase n=1 Tax=Vibrio sp. JC009 TaxID=2912314 RepID=UPI0023B1C9F8|nr:bifunctional hydroxymethylpyrimidine kinase/phosphomethylpyrimidine kinase [Vibrio sp. JC009]WED24749.1 bifunctional hydroxymethylpyrimidine kinase/phosphomethylpyrimidine kinase [Vibrio sp. JC009]
MSESTSVKPTKPIVLTIAGSDSGGGAGIQADIKAISATGSYACSVITALTAQNTQGVTDIMPVPAGFVAAQLDAVFQDLDIRAVKIGMLADSNIIRLIAEKLRQYQPQHVVLDPVMVATSGDPLIEEEAIATLKQELLPLATLITPNLPEAAKLIDQELPTQQEQLDSFLDQLHQLDTRSALIKGGHLFESSNSDDYLLSKGEPVQVFSGKRIETRNTHGTGCTLSSAIASYLAQGQALTDAISSAKTYITTALQHADELNVGQGHGPVNHFYMI